MLENGELHVVDASKTIQRYACKVCGTHMYGRIENKGHPFYGLRDPLFTPSCSRNSAWRRRASGSALRSRPDRAGQPEQMDGIRHRLKELGLEPMICLLLALMDAIATDVSKIEGRPATTVRVIKARGGSTAARSPRGA